MRVAGPNDEERDQQRVSMRTSLARSSSSVLDRSATTRIMRKFGYTVVRGLFIVVCLLGAWFAARGFIERLADGYKSLAAGLAIAGSAAFLFSEVMLERIIKFEYDRHRGSWLEDNCPRVSFWGPDNHRACSFLTFLVLTVL